MQVGLPGPHPPYDPTQEYLHGDCLNDHGHFTEQSDDAIMTGSKFVTMVREGQYKLVYFIDTAPVGS